MFKPIVVSTLLSAVLVVGVIAGPEFVAKDAPPSRADHFTDSDGHRIQTDKALWYCYKEVMFAAKREKLENPDGVYWKCLFNYGVVL